MSVAEDGSRTFVSGLEKGAAGIAGLPGSADDWLSKRIDDGAVGLRQALGFANDPEALRRRLYEASEQQRRNSFLTRYTVGDFNRKAQATLGAYHEPQTSFGRFADEFGQNTSGALLAGGLGRALEVTPPLMSAAFAGASDLRPVAAAAEGSPRDVASDVLPAEGGRGFARLWSPVRGAESNGAEIQPAKLAGQTRPEPIEPPPVDAQKPPGILGRAPRKDYRKTFLERHPELKDQVTVHHAVPRAVLTKYPGLFQESEIHAYENLRGIPNEINREVHAKRITGEWGRFFKENPKATRSDILQKADDIDRRYGHQFKPPVSQDQGK